MHLYNRVFRLANTIFIAPAMLLLSILVALLSGFGLVVGLNNAQPNLDIWDIVASCIPHQSTLRKAYNDVAVMAAKALRDVQFVQQPRPSHLQDRIEWERIARAFENMFGFKPGEEGTGPEDIYFKKVLGKSYTYKTISPPLFSSCLNLEVNYTRHVPE